MVLRLEDLMARIDGELHAHFEAEGLQYLQFAFRWMNCFLIRFVRPCDDSWQYMACSTWLEIRDSW